MRGQWGRAKKCEEQGGRAGMNGALRKSRN